MEVKMKRWFAALVLSGCLFIQACGGAKSSDSVPAGGPVGSTAEDGYTWGQPYYNEEGATYTIYWNDHSAYPAKNDWLFWSAIKEKTNVTLNPIIVPKADYDTKILLVAASGDAPYLLSKTHNNLVKKLQPSGILVPISDWFGYMPNFTHRVETWQLQPDIETYRLVDGKIYTLPGLNEKAVGVNQGNTFAYRKDIFDKAGVEIDQKNYTWESLFDAFRKVKNSGVYNGEYIWADRRHLEGTLQAMGYVYHTLGGYDLNTNTTMAYLYDYDKDEFYFPNWSKNYQDEMKLLNTMVKEKILDPECITRTLEQSDQALYQGKSLFTFTTLPHMNDAIAAMEKILGPENFELAPLISPGGPVGQIVRGMPRVGEAQLGISTNALRELGNEKFAELCKFVDWIYNSDEGNEFVKWGIEGVTYTKNAQGKRILNSDILYNGINLSTYTKQLNVDYGFHGGIFTNGGSFELLTSMYDAQSLEIADAFVQYRTYEPLAPTLQTTDDETEELVMTAQNIIDYCRTMQNKFIVGQADPVKDWDSYVAQLKSLGVDHYINRVNQIYKASKK
jgi:putative aldouronate transport system substrate-binding protein